MNKINATGVLIRTGRGQYGYAEISVLVRRRGMDDAYINFVLDTVLDPTITVNSMVTVEGHMRGYNTRNIETGKRNVVQYCVATKVTHAERELHKIFGVEGHFSPKQEFSMALKGTVISIINTSERWKRIGLKLEGSREVPDIISVSINKRNRVPDYDAIRKGDTIVAVANIFTPVSDKKGKYEDIILEDYKIINRDINDNSAIDKTVKKNEPESTGDFEETEE